MASESDAKPWGMAEQGRSLALEIVLHQKQYVFPWIQFVYAEGGPDTVRIHFATHEVLVEGAGLERLLEDVGSYSVRRLQQPPRGQKFIASGTAEIRQVSVQPREH